MSIYQEACAWARVQKIRVEYRAKRRVGNYQHNLMQEWLSLLHPLLT